MKNWLHPISTTLLVALSACGHGPPERFTMSADYDTADSANVMIALRNFTVDRPPRGLSAFPDGGFALPLDDGVEVNLCDASSGRFRQIAVVHDTVKKTTDFSTSSIREWLDTAVRITRPTGGEVVVALPPGIRLGAGRKDPSRHRVLPACRAALDSLWKSKRMPDGHAVTDDGITG